RPARGPAAAVRPGPDHLVTRVVRTGAEGGAGRHRHAHRRLGAVVPGGSAGRPGRADAGRVHLGDRLQPLHRRVAGHRRHLTSALDSEQGPGTRTAAYHWRSSLLPPDRIQLPHPCCLHRSEHMRSRHALTAALALGVVTILTVAACGSAVQGSAQVNSAAAETMTSSSAQTTSARTSRTSTAAPTDLSDLSSM